MIILGANKKTEGTEDTEVEEAKLGENPLIKKSTLILTFAQFTRGLCQFHLLYNVAKLGGDFWINNFINNEQFAIKRQFKAKERVMHYNLCCLHIECLH